MSNTIRDYKGLQEFLIRTGECAYLENMVSEFYCLPSTSQIKSSFYLKAEIGCGNANVGGSVQNIGDMFYDLGTGEYIYRD